MKEYLIKVKYIIPTFLFIIIGSVLLSLFFRWIFTIEYEIIIIKKEVFDIWIPLIIPWIPISIWLRPKLRILEFKDRDTASFFYQLIAWLIIAAVMMISNNYLKTATGSLSELTTISELESGTGYLKIENIDLNRKSGSAHTEFKTSGKYNNQLNFHSYFVYPFNEKNKIEGYTYWYGVKFTKQISNNITDEEKKNTYKLFFKKAAKDFEDFEFSNPNYFEILQHSDDRNGFVAAIRKRNKTGIDKLVIIKPKKGVYSDRNGNTLFWIFGSFGIGFTFLLFALIFPKYNSTEHQKQLKGIRPKSDDLVDILRYLIPRGEHFVTSIIIDLNILIFILMALYGVNIISPNGIALLEWGANRREETMNGSWWRLVSSMFLHGGIMHIFVNIFGLCIASLFVEPIFGRIKYFTIYLVSGICGSLASIYWYENTISVGASGAIFGVYGSLLGLLLMKGYPKNSKQEIVVYIVPYVGINLLFGLLTEGIDNAAHIGGLVSGTVIGIILYLTNNQKKVV